MIERWKAFLPQEYSDLAIKPVAFERNTEPSVNADKTVGFDTHGKACFYYHTYTLLKKASILKSFQY